MDDAATLRINGQIRRLRSIFPTGNENYLELKSMLQLFSRSLTFLILEKF